MYKKLAAIIILLASTNSFADCGATAKSNTEWIMHGHFHYWGVYNISINNTTDTDQTYEVCREAHAQFVDHTYHFSAASCEHFTIKAHEGLAQQLGTKLDTLFPTAGPTPGVHLDAIIHIRGVCNADGYEHKVVPLQ